MKNGLIFVLLILLVIIVLIWHFRGKVPDEASTPTNGKELVDKRPPILLKTASGIETTDFQLHDTLLFNAVNLLPRTGYTVQVVREDNTIVTESILSTDQKGRIPETVIWYDIGIQFCNEVTDHTKPVTNVSEYQIFDRTYSGKNYTLKIIKDAQLVRETVFRVTDENIRPRLYAADYRGCPKSGFLIGEEDVWVVGSDFPKGSIVRLWAVPANTEWKDSDKFRDKTKQYDDQLPPLFEFKGSESGFKKLLWPKGLTSIGSYDIVAEVVTYQFGFYHESVTAKVANVLSNYHHTGFVIQRRLGIGEPLEQDAAGVRMSKLAFRDTFLTTENVYVGVDPYIHPSYIGQEADIYIVADKTDAQWSADKSLNDITGTVETKTIQQGGCANAYSSLAWSSPLTPGKYDVVLDFNRDGQYDHGTDLIDSLDASGFTVAEVRVESISFNYSDSGAVTIYDNKNNANISPPEYSCGPCEGIKPAAWTMGSNHSVQVNFKAAPSVNFAHIWAESGMGGLNSTGSPVMVTFLGGNGQGTFTTNSVPSSIGKQMFEWNWKYKNVNGVFSGDLDIGRTGRHMVYMLFDSPQPPQTVPWLMTLDIASFLAAGRTTASSATRDIWDDFYNNAGGLYDTGGGAPKYTGSTTMGFNLTSWLMNYDSGNIGVVNCYDMGKSVVIFSNALGADTFYAYVNPFGNLNCVKPIGRDWTNNPFNPANPVVDGDSTRTGFGNHGFSMLRLGGQIYDGSGGQVDVDTDPDNCSSYFPRNLDGNDSWFNDYKNRVVDFVPLYWAGNPGTPVEYEFNVY